MHFKPFKAESVSQNFVSDLTIWKISWPNPYKKKVQKCVRLQDPKKQKKVQRQKCGKSSTINVLKGKLKKKHGPKWLEML